MKRTVFHHPHPVWGDHADHAILVRAPEYDDDREQAFEELHCRREGQDLFRLCSVPLFAKDIFPDDVIRLDTAGHPQTVVRGEWWSLRVWDEQGSLTADYLNGLRAKGMLVETMNSIIGIACKGEALVDAMRQELERLEQTMPIDWETGWS
jgi:hypothetical protein